MSNRNVEEPVSVPYSVGACDPGSKTTHPAFGQIVAHRISGTRALYGSDFLHNNYVEITIAESELIRDLSCDRHFSGKELISVCLSEAQWATFVSAMQMRGGPPCTIGHVGGKQRPELPDPIDRSKQFAGELDSGLKKCITKMRTTIAELEAMGLPKGKTATIRASMESCLSYMSSTAPFVASQFGEHVEETVEKAKQEIHGHMQNVIHRSGIAALKGEPLPLQIGDGKTA